MKSKRPDLSLPWTKNDLYNLNAANAWAKKETTWLMNSTSYIQCIYAHTHTHVTLFHGLEEQAHDQWCQTPGPLVLTWNCPSPWPSLWKAKWARLKHDIQYFNFNTQTKHIVYCEIFTPHELSTAKFLLYFFFTADQWRRSSKSSDTWSWAFTLLLLLATRSINAKRYETISMKNCTLIKT